LFAIPTPLETPGGVKASPSPNYIGNYEHWGKQLECPDHPPPGVEQVGRIYFGGA